MNPSAPWRLAWEIDASKTRRSAFRSRKYVRRVATVTLAINGEGSAITNAHYG